MSLLTIHFHDDGSKPTVTVAAQEITSDIKEDDFVKGVVASYLQMMGEKMEQVIGHSAVPLDGRFSSIRTQVTALFVSCIVALKGTYIYINLYDT